jgi:hypothetical protein
MPIVMEKKSFQPGDARLNRRYCGKHRPMPVMAIKAMRQAREQYARVSYGDQPRRDLARWRRYVEIHNIYRLLLS